MCLVMTAPRCVFVSAEMELRERLAVLLGLAELLREIAAIRVRYRDVNFGSIMIDPTGRVFLIDLGNARLHDRAPIEREGTARMPLAVDDYLSAKPFFLPRNTWHRTTLALALMEAQELARPTNVDAEEREAALATAAAIETELASQSHLYVDDLEPAVWWYVVTTTGSRTSWPHRTRKSCGLILDKSGGRARAGAALLYQ